jgi:peptidoglycan/LPS O-acetylase OafA/YrhL
MDGARGVAALFVMTRHSAQLWPFHFHRNYLAVDLFFMLSGFVIAGAYDRKLASQALSPARFMAVRLIRLGPMYLASALLAMAWFTSHPSAISEYDGGFAPALAVSAVLTLVMLPSRLSPNVSLYPLNGPYWSLMFELLTNAAFALLHPRLTRRALCATVGVSLVLLGVVAALHGDLNVGWAWGAKSFAAGLTRAVFGLFLGVALQRHGASMPGRAWASLRGHPWLALTAVALVLGSPSAGALDGVVDLACVALVFPACVIAFTADCRRPAAGYVLTTLGAASYPMYVLHMPLASLTVAALHRAGIVGLTGLGPVFALAMVLACAALERRVDAPVRAWLSRRFVPGSGSRPAVERAGRPPR